MKKLVEMMKPFVLFALSYDEQWNGMIYDDCEEKNFVTSMSHHELLGLTHFRLKLMLFFIEICSRSLDYESIKEIYKK